MPFQHRGGSCNGVAAPNCAHWVGRTLVGASTWVEQLCPACWNSSLCNTRQAMCGDAMREVGFFRTEKNGLGDDRSRAIVIGQSAAGGDETPSQASFNGDATPDGLQFRLRVSHGMSVRCPCQVWHRPKHTSQPGAWGTIQWSA